MDEQVQILVIDDDAVDRAAVRRALRSSGLAATLVEVEDSTAAQAALQTSAFDCILLDYRLPDADGLEVLSTLRAAGIKTPVIVLTGQGDEQVAVEIMKAGAADYLTKGRLSADRLASSIRHALRVYQAEMQADEATALRQQAEAALRQNERLLASTLKSIGDAVIATDASGRVIFMNSVAEMLTGWAAPTAAGESIERILPFFDPQTLLPIASPSAQVLGTGMTLELNGDVLSETRDGQRYPVASSIAPIRGDDGTAVGVVVVFRDMTEHVRSQERLRMLAEVSQLLSSSLDYLDNLSRLVDLMAPQFADFCAIDVIREDRTIERIAVATSEVVCTTSSVASKGYIIDAEQTYGPAQVIRLAQTEYYPDLSVSAPNGVKQGHREFVAETGLTSWICVPLFVRGGTLGVLSVARTEAKWHFTQDDVTFVEELAQRSSLAVDNALLYEEAKAAIQTRDAFLSIAAHELKTPLTAMMGYVELLQRRVKRNPQLEERDQRMLSVMMDQARRLTKMIQSLFDLSRLQIGQLTLERLPIDIAMLASRIVAEIGPTLERHTLHIEIDDQQLVVSGDELRLEQVIQNLIHNAVKYSPNGGSVLVRVAREDLWVRVSVQDYGIGIPRESLNSIFQRFYRATNTDVHRISGMGVGLYVVRQIVDLHGGRVEVESVEGQGSTFIIWLPFYIE